MEATAFAEAVHTASSNPDDRDSTRSSSFETASAIARNSSPVAAESPPPEIALAAASIRSARRVGLRGEALPTAAPTCGEGGAGTIQQGMLEVSNVNVVEEMIDLISGQRAYEVNSRVIKAADEMLGETAQLR